MLIYPHIRVKGVVPCTDILHNSDLTSLIPMLILLLSNESTFVGASDVLQEIMASSVLSDGAGTKTLTEPLLAYLSQGGAAIVEQTLTGSCVTYTTHYSQLNKSHLQQGLLTTSLILYVNSLSPLVNIQLATSLRISLPLQLNRFSNFYFPIPRYRGTTVSTKTRVK